MRTLASQITKIVIVCYAHPWHERQGLARAEQWNKNSLIWQQNGNVSWRWESALKGVNAISGAQFSALPLTKPVVWFALAVITDVPVLLLNQLISREQRGLCSDYRVFIKIFNLSFILFLSISLARYTLATLYLLLNTVELRYNEPLYNEVLGVTNDFLYPVIVKYKKKNLDFGSPLALRYIEVPL